MNETITATLREHAEGDIHIDRLLGAVHAGARRRQRRRRSAGGVALILVAVAALVGVRGLTLHRVPVADPAPPAMPRPPRVDAAVTASDATMFHLDLPDLGWTSLSWAAQPGHETLSGELASGQEVRIEADRERDGLTWRDGPRWPVTVAGQPAEAISVAAGLYAVQWQPVPGIWAQAAIFGADVHAAAALAEQVRFDRAYRCAAAFSRR